MCIRDSYENQAIAAELYGKARQYGEDGTPMSRRDIGKMYDLLEKLDELETERLYDLAAIPLY